jgi:hypothetical protein
MKIMEKKIYTKPKVERTKLDFTININLDSFTPPPSINGQGGSGVTTPPSGFFNPFNWLK